MSFCIFPVSKIGQCGWKPGQAFYCLSRNPDRLSEFSVTLPNIHDRINFRSGSLGLSLAIMKKLKKGGGNSNFVFFVFLSYQVMVRLNTKNLLHSLLGRALKVFVVVGGGLRANLVIAFGLALAQPRPSRTKQFAWLHMCFQFIYFISLL